MFYESLALPAAQPQERNDRDVVLISASNRPEAGDHVENMVEPASTATKKLDLFTSFITKRTSTPLAEKPMRSRKPTVGAEDAPRRASARLAETELSKIPTARHVAARSFSWDAWTCSLAVNLQRPRTPSTMYSKMAYVGTTHPR